MVETGSSQTESGKESAGSGKRVLDFLRYILTERDEEPKMKRLISVGAACLMGMTAVCGLAQPAGTGTSAASRFVGAWRLASLEQPGADGKLRKITCCGMLVYTNDGHMSVQVMERDPQIPAPLGSEQYSQGGYEASYGRYEADERTHTFTFHVEGALVRTLIGKDLPRSYEFSGKQLIVKSTRSDEHWRVVWERY